MPNAAEALTRRGPGGIFFGGVVVLTWNAWVTVGICMGIAFLSVWLFCRKEEKRRLRKMFIAVALCLVIAVVATLLSKVQRYVGAPMLGLLIGMLMINLFPRVDTAFRSGTAFAGKKFLSLGIILTGGTLNFADVLSATKALPLIVFNICLAFLISALIGKKVIGVSGNTCVLVGGGTSICGGTAIATLSSIIKAKEEEIAYAMTAIFLFDVLAAVSYPYLAGILELTQSQFGYLAGTAINDTSSVAAAQETYAALNNLTDYSMPVTVKLVRTTMLIALAVIFTAVTIHREAQACQVQSGKGENALAKVILKVFPWFILCFIVMSLLNTCGVLKLVPGSSEFFQTGYKFYVTVALAGVGFKIRLKDLFTKGGKPILLGGVTWLSVAVSSFSYIFLFAERIG